MLTRKDYMAMPYSDCRAEMNARHRQYYGQFVTPATISLVVAAIGAKRIRESTDPNMNDIPLSMWDSLVPGLPGSGKFKEAGDYYTLAGGVCLAKEAARQWLESTP